jgi:hypothetical protein
MSSSIIEEKLRKLPPDAQEHVKDYIEFISLKHSKKTLDKSYANKLSSSSFFGIWKDRPEMNDSTDWVRSLRKSQWSE